MLNVTFGPSCCWPPNWCHESFTRTLGLSSSCIPQTKGKNASWNDYKFAVLLYLSKWWSWCMLLHQGRRNPAMSPLSFAVQQIPLLIPPTKLQASIPECDQSKWSWSLRKGIKKCCFGRTKGRLRHYSSKASSSSAAEKKSKMRDSRLLWLSTACSTKISMGWLDKLKGGVDWEGSTKIVHHQHGRWRRNLWMCTRLWTVLSEASRLAHVKCMDGKNLVQWIQMGSGVYKLPSYRWVNI